MPLLVSLPVLMGGDGGGAVAGAAAEVVVAAAANVVVPLVRALSSLVMLVLPVQCRWCWWPLPHA